MLPSGAVVPIVGHKSRARRIVHEDAVNALAKPSLARIRAGRLANLMGMPTDIFFEIVTRLDPLDLLHLARVSKHLRSIFMSKKSRHLWIAARKNIPGMPECPEWLAEPRYAWAVFDQYCFACGVGRSSKRQLALLMVFCAACDKENIQPGSSVQSKEPVLWSLSEVAAHQKIWLRAISDRDSNDVRHNQSWDHYYRPALRAVARALESIRTEDEWKVFVQSRKEEAQKRQTFGKSVIQWDQDRRRRAYEEAIRLKELRRTSIEAKLLELGYAEEEFPHNGAWNKIMDQPRELNERIWKAVRPKLEKLLEQAKEDRIEAAFGKRRASRRKEIHAFYQTFVESEVAEAERPLMPNLHDACLLPCLAELASVGGAHNPLTEEQFAAVKGQLLVEARHYSVEVKTDMMQMLERNVWLSPVFKPSKPEYDMARVDAALARASSLFICHHCPIKTPLPFPEILTHWQTHAHLKWNAQWPAEDTNTRPWVCAMPMAHSLVKVALRSVGLAQDTAMATADDLVRSGRLVCMCGNPQLPFPGESSWAILFQHIMQEQSWFAHKERCFGSDTVPAGLLNNDHQLYGRSSCLKLLADGEEAIIEPYLPSQEVIAAVEAVMSETTRFPSCRTCRDIDKSQWRSPSLYMPRSVTVLAHHVKTKHYRYLLQDDVVFDA